MKFFLSFLTLLFFCITAFSQIIHYTNTRLYNSSAYRYNIVGEVNNNIIIWKTYLNKRYDADILVYDNSMKLINTINTKILQSDEDANPEFFVAGNTFKVIYQYKTQSALLFKHAVFNKDGHIIYNRILDSVTIADFFNNENILYQTLPFRQNKGTCFIKMTDDIKNHMLKFSCSFLSETDTSRKNFTVSFDENHESLAGIYVDNDKNVLLLKHRKLDSSVNLELIKIIFSDDFILTAGKTIGKYFFKANSIQVAQRPGGYTVSGILKKENTINTNYIQNEGLYVWQINDALNNAPGDTLINKKDEKDVLTYNASITNDEMFSTVFVVGISDQEKTSYRPYAWHYINPSWPHTTAMSPSYFSYDNAGLIIEQKTDFPDAFYNNFPTGSSVYNDHYKKIELLKLDSNNTVIWKNTFTDSIDNTTSANFNNAGIIAGGKALHIIYEVPVKKHLRSLDHIAIRPDGTFSNEPFTAWSMKYQYILSKGVVTGKNEFIVPAIKGNKIKFAKMKIE